MPVRCLIDISQSFSRRYWPIVPVIENSAAEACSMSRSTPRQRVLGDVRVVAERQQHLLLALEFLQQVGLEVGAPGDLQDLEQREQRHVVVERVGARDEMARALEQVLQPQQRPDALVQRVLVRDNGQKSLAEGENARILSDLARATQIALLSFGQREVFFVQFFDLLLQCGKRA